MGDDDVRAFMVCDLSSGAKLLDHTALSGDKRNVSARASRFHELTEPTHIPAAGGGADMRTFFDLVLVRRDHRRVLIVLIPAS